MKIVKVIGFGELLPPFYGIAWARYDSDSAVCLPVPINIVAALVRSFWLFMRCGGKPVYLNPRDAFMQGMRAGRQAKAKEKLK